jgi:hypothetical protein
MTWPNTTISTANVDSGSDTPANARAQIYDTITAVNEMITGGPPLGALGFAYIRTLENTNFGGTYKANVSVTFQSGNVITTSNQGYTLTLAAGTYLVDFVATGEISGDGTVTLDPEPAWIASVAGTSFAPGSGVNAGKFAVYNSTDNVFTANVQFNANLVVTDQPTGSPPVRSIRIYRLA